MFRYSGSNSARPRISIDYGDEWHSFLQSLTPPVPPPVPYDIAQASIAGASLVSMQQYISDPARIVYACWDHPDITPLGEGVFRLAFTGQSFLSVSIDMSVDISLEIGANCAVKVKSVGYSMEYMAKLLGQDFVDSFFLDLEGELRVAETETKVRALTLKNTLLSGDVAVTIGGKVKDSLAGCLRSNEF